MLVKGRIICYYNSIKLGIFKGVEFMGEKEKRSNTIFITQCILIGLLVLSAIGLFLNAFHLDELAKDMYSSGQNYQIYLTSIKPLLITAGISLLVLILCFFVKGTFRKNNFIKIISNVVLVIVSLVVVILLSIVFVKLFTSLEKAYWYQISNSQLYDNYNYNLADQAVCQELQASIVSAVILVCTIGILSFVDIEKSENKRSYFLSFATLCAIVTVILFSTFGLYTTSDVDKKFSTYVFNYSSPDGASFGVRICFCNFSEENLNNATITCEYKVDGESQSDTYEAALMSADTRYSVFDITYEKEFELVSVTLNSDEYKNYKISKYDTFNSQSLPYFIMGVVTLALTITFGVLYCLPSRKKDKNNNTKLPLDAQNSDLKVEEKAETQNLNLNLIENTAAQNQDLKLEKAPDTQNNTN